MTARTAALDWDDAMARTRSAERLEAAFAIFVDPQRDPDSISLAARLTAGVVLSPVDLPADHHEPCFYDPCACSQNPTTRPADTTQD